MAPKKAGRKRESVAAVPAAKKAKVDPASQGVTEAIEQATELPESCRKMLLASVPMALGRPCDERHEVQAAVVAMIGSALEGVQARLQAAADGEAAKLGAAEARRAELAAAATAAEEVLAVASRDVEGRAASLARATEAALAAKGRVQERLEQQRAGDVAMAQAKESQAAVERGLEEHLRGILEGTGGEPAQEHYASLRPLLEGLALDESLTSALPSVCAKPPAAHGSFDVMVLEQLRLSLVDRRTVVARAVSEALPAAEQRAAAVSEAEAEAEAAAEALQAATEALNEASTKKQSAAGLVKQAREALEVFEPEHAQATKVRDEEAEKLENFKLFNVGSFELLRDRRAAAPAAVAPTGGA